VARVLLSAFEGFVGVHDIAVVFGGGFVFLRLRRFGVSRFGVFAVGRRRGGCDKQTTGSKQISRDEGQTFPPFNQHVPAAGAAAAAAAAAGAAAAGAASLFSLRAATFFSSTSYTRVPIMLLCTTEERVSCNTDQSMRMCGGADIR
jgi:hypothetical protein